MGLAKGQKNDAARRYVGQLLTRHFRHNGRGHRLRPLLLIDPAITPSAERR